MIPISNSSRLSLQCSRSHKSLHTRDPLTGPRPPGVARRDGGGQGKIDSAFPVNGDDASEVAVDEVEDDVFAPASASAPWAARRSTTGQDPTSGRNDSRTLSEASAPKYRTAWVAPSAR